MKYSIITAVMLITLIIGCDPPKPSSEPRTPEPSSEPRTPEADWNFWLKLQEETGRKVLSVTESEQWINENRSKISMPTKLSFMEQHLVMEEPFLQQMTIITVDHNSKYRIVAKGFDYPPPPSDPPTGFLDENESKNWLKTHGYQLVKITDGYTIKKKSPGININITLQGSGTAMNTLMEGVTVMHQNGRIYISR